MEQAIDRTPLLFTRMKRGCSLMRSDIHNLNKRSRILAKKRKKNGDHH